MAADGKQKLADVTAESLKGWSVAYKHGADLTALAEVVGLYLQRFIGQPIDKVPMPWRRIFEDAARLKAQRASRPQR